MRRTFLWGTLLLLPPAHGPKRLHEDPAVLMVTVDRARLVVVAGRAADEEDGEHAVTGS